MSDTVLFAIDGPRATITLNDPAKHNRLDPAGLDLLMAAVETADANPDIRVTVITGAGDKTFCSGYDLGSIPAGGEKPAARFGLHYYPSGLRRYTQKVSPSFAKRAFLLSEDFTDANLLAVGYLDWLVERSEFRGKIDELSNRLATLAPLSMVNMKRAIEQFAQAEPDISAIRQNMRECATSEDLREGLAALRERRPPAFKGR